MFIQVMQGRVADAGAARARLDTWVRDLAPSADGWLGTTAGVTADGEFVAVVRFVDEESARRNSDRAEQGEWWAETSGMFEGDAQFHDYPTATLMLGGGSDDAGFVQVIQGVYTGEGTPADMDGEDDLAELRPDVIGGSVGWDDRGHFTQTVYFTSEAEAREGEKAMEDHPEVGEEMGAWAAQVQDLRYLDLTDPWISSPT